MNTSSNYIEFLGTGTSVGIPMIGCNCRVCTSEDSKDNRLRASIYVSYEDKDIQIDAGPDFRTQMLRAGIENLDAVLITHEHRDHIGGLDDLRPFMFKNRKPFPIFLTEQVLKEVKKTFSYAFAEQKYPGAPRFATNKIVPGESFGIDGIEILPIPVFHGNLPIVGYKIAKVAYLTDVSQIPDDSMKLLKDIDVLVMSALRHEPHHSHFTVDQALDIIKILSPQRAYLTHISHQFGLIAEEQIKMPPNVEIAYDGLKVYF